MRAPWPLSVGCIALALCACGPTDAPVSQEAPAPRAVEAAPSAAPDDEAPMWLEVDATSVDAQLRAHPARLLLVNLWSTWCEPCVEEMPMLLSTAQRYEDRGLAVVLISTDPRSQREAAARFLDEHQIPRPRWIKSGSEDAFIQAVHPEWTGALPMTLLLDEERRVVRFREGAVTEAWLVESIEALGALGDEG